MTCCNAKFTFAPAGEACWVKADGTKETLKEMAIFDCEGKPSGSYYHEVGDVGVAVDTGADVVTSGACPVAAPDNQWLDRCELLADGTTVKFLRRVTTTFDGNGVPIDPVLIKDFELDGVTAYTVIDEDAVGECDGCVPAAPVGLVTDLAALYTTT